jgi:hypothetical protein
MVTQRGGYNRKNEIILSTVHVGANVTFSNDETPRCSSICICSPIPPNYSNQTHLVVDHRGKSRGGAYEGEEDGCTLHFRLFILLSLSLTATGWMCNNNKASKLQEEEHFSNVWYL